MEDQAGWRQEMFPFALLGENVTGPGRVWGRTAAINTLGYYLQLLLKWSPFLQRLHCGPG